MTVKEYAKSRGVTVQAVTKAIRENRKLPGIIRVEKYGRYYLLIWKKPKKLV